MLVHIIPPFGIQKIFTYSMSCPTITCDFVDKPRDFPTITNASNYTAIKRNRVLYSKYTLNNTGVVCSDNPTAIYKSYELRRNIKYGCFWNKRVCLKTCLNDQNNI